MRKLKIRSHPLFQTPGLGTFCLVYCFASWVKVLTEWLPPLPAGDAQPLWPGLCSQSVHPQASASESSCPLSPSASSFFTIIKDLAFQNLGFMDNVPQAREGTAPPADAHGHRTSTSYLPAAGQPQDQAPWSPPFTGPQEVARVAEALLQESAGNSRDLTRASPRCLDEGGGVLRAPGRG